MKNKKYELIFTGADFLLQYHCDVGIWRTIRGARYDSQQKILVFWEHNNSEPKVFYKHDGYLQLLKFRNVEACDSVRHAECCGDVVLWLPSDVFKVVSNEQDLQKVLEKLNKKL